MGASLYFGYVRGGRILISDTSASSYRALGFNNSVKGAQRCLLTNLTPFACVKVEPLLVAADLKR